MTEEIKKEEKKEGKIDYKEFSRLLMFEGLIPAFGYAAKFTETSLDDLAVKGLDGLGKLFLSKKEE